MPRVMGTVAGRVHNHPAHRARVSSMCRWWLPFDLWEAELVEKWKQAGVGVETIAMRTMRPVSQIEMFDPQRPNGRRM